MKSLIEAAASELHVIFYLDTTETKKVATKSSASAGAGGLLDTIESDQELTSSMEEPANFRPERSLMEALLAQKMARAAKYMRSNSTASIDSACSARSNLSTSSELNQVFYYHCNIYKMTTKSLLFEWAAVNTTINFFYRSCSLHKEHFGHTFSMA